MLDQGRLAGAVFADEPVHFALVNVEIDAAQSGDAGKRFRQPPNPDRWGFGHCRRPAPNIGCYQCGVNLLMFSLVMKIVSVPSTSQGRSSRLT